MASRNNNNPEDERQIEAQRILKRVERESEQVGDSSMARTAKKVQDHFLASEAQDDDRIEVLGKRIGRILSVIVFVFLAIFLFNTYIAPK